MAEVILNEMNNLINYLERIIKNKVEEGITILNNIKTEIKKNPNYIVDDEIYNRLMNIKEKFEIIVETIVNDIDKKINKLQQIKSIGIMHYKNILDDIGILMNKQRIGSLLQHSLIETEKIVTHSKKKPIRKTVLPQLLKYSRQTVKESKKNIGGFRKTKKQMKN
jgi:predicted site-specific integrase-resolvase